MNCRRARAILSYIIQEVECSFFHSPTEIITGMKAMWFILRRELISVFFQEIKCYDVIVVVTYDFSLRSRNTPLSEVRWECVAA